MRALCLVIPLFIARPAAALKPATSEQILAIQGYMDTAQELSEGPDGINKYSADLKKAETSINRDEKTIRGIEAKIAAMTKQRDAARDKAIHLTLRAYGILPSDSEGRLISPRGTVVMQDFKNKVATWIPISADNGPRPALDASGKVVVVPRAAYPDGSDVIAATAHDGVTLMFGESFMSPGLLALTLFHELIHFKQCTTPGVGNKRTYAELEVAAYEAESHQINQIGLTDRELNIENEKLFGDPASGTTGQLDKWRANALNDHSRTSWKSPFGSGGSSSEPTVPLSPDRSSLQRQFDDLDAVVAAEIRTADEESRRQEDHANAIAKRRNDTARLKSALSSLAEKICSDPDSVDQGQLDRLPRDGDTHSILIGNLPRFDNACSRSAYTSMGLILAQDGTLDLEQLRSAVRSNAPAPLPPPLEPAPSPASPPPADPYWQARALYNLSWKACQPGMAVNQDDIDALGPFPTGGIIPGTAGLAAGISGCWRSMFDRLLAANRPGTDLTPALLAQWVVEAQPRQPPPYHRRDPDDRPDPPPHPKHCIPRDPAHPDIPGSCEEGYHD